MNAHPIRFSSSRMRRGARSSPVQSTLVCKKRHHGCTKLHRHLEVQVLGRVLEPNGPIDGGAEVLEVVCVQIGRALAIMAARMPLRLTKFISISTRRSSTCRLPWLIGKNGVGRSIRSSVSKKRLLIITPASS